MQCRYIYTLFASSISVNQYLFFVVCIRMSRSLYWFLSLALSLS